MYDTVIFDLDGTLLNTLDDLKNSVNFALEKYGFPKRSIDEIRSFVGNGVERLVMLSVPVGTDEATAGEVLAVFKAHYEKNSRVLTAPYDGIKDLLGELSRRGIKMAVVSNKFDAAVKELCSDFFGGLLAAAIGESDTVKRKPAPDSVFEALSQLGSRAECALYVGDSEVDVATAQNAGLFCVGVTWGFRSRALLEEKGADCIIERPSELLGVLAL